jgi:arabinose-5-phosphate isomerase
MNYSAQGRKVIDIEISGLQHVRKKIGTDFAEAVKYLQETCSRRGKIILTGVGKSGHIAEKIAATLTSTGAPSVLLNAVNAVHGDLGVVSEGDILIALSYSGETEELVRILPALRRLSVKLIGVTGNPQSTVAKQADVHLDVRVPLEACPLNLAPTSSTTAMLAMGDALAMVLLQARGFKKEDFARFHPGGHLGKHLLLRIDAVMRPIEQVPVLSERATVTEALHLWAQKRAGAVAVVDGKGKLSGIYTHGDFIRGYQEDSEVGKKMLKSVMTPRPITVRVDKLAVEVLNLFQKHRIDDLVVVDKNHKPIGLVDAQDLAKQRLL